MTLDPQTGKLPNVVKYLTTASVSFGCLTIANAVAFFSPALVELKNKYDTDVETMSKMFTIIPFANFCGSIIGGLLYGRFVRRQYATAFCFLGVSISLLTVPYTTNLLQIYICVGALGFFVGGYRTAEAVWLVEMWQSKSGPFLQFQHFFWALGTALPPFIVTPFLSSNNNNMHNLTSPDAAEVTEEESNNLVTPFTIAGCMTLCTFFFESFLLMCYPYRKPRRDSDATIEVDEEKPEKNECTTTQDIQKPIIVNSKWYKIKLIILMLFFLGFYMGGEICSIQFMSAFAQFGDLHLSEAEGASALSAMTGAFAVGRFLGIFVTLKVSPMIILLGNMILISGASALLLFFSGLSIKMLWIGCALLGLGYSTIFPSFMAFMERHLIFTDFLGAVILVGGSVVAMIYPTIVGMYIEQVPLVFTYMDFFTATVCSVSLLLLRQLTRKKSVK